jgi:hypothetical protein
MLDGEYVVSAGAGDRRRGVGLGVHRVHGYHDICQVQAGQQGPHRRDLVALGRGGQLAEHGAAGVVVRRHQMRGRGGGGAGTAHGLPVDRDHPAPARDPGPGPHQGADHLIQDGRVKTGQDLAER